MKSNKDMAIAVANGTIDWFGRDTFIDEFVDYLVSRDKSTHVCLDGVWGSGKTTTILGMIKKISGLDTKPLVVYFDAWKYENYDHPIYALISILKKEDSELFKRMSTEVKSRKIIPQLNLGIPNLFELSFHYEKEGENQLLLNNAEYIEELNEVLEIIIKKYKKEKGNDLIIFVDELDRARPDFVMKTLEVFHHLDDELPTHFVYSVDLVQLSSMIKHHYGYEYNVDIFTHKIFDEFIKLETIEENEINRYIKEMYTKLTGSFSLSGLTRLTSYYLKNGHLESLRSVNRVCSNIGIVLKNDYFLPGSDIFHRSDFFMGGSNLWGYIELVIILQVIALDDILKARRYVSGLDLDELSFEIHKIIQNQLRESKDNRIAAFDNKLIMMIVEYMNMNVSDADQMLESKDIDADQILNFLHDVFSPLEYKSVFADIRF